MGGRDAYIKIKNVDFVNLIFKYQNCKIEFLTLLVKIELKIKYLVIV